MGAIIYHITEGASAFGAEKHEPAKLVHANFKGLSFMPNGCKAQTPRRELQGRSQVNGSKDGPRRTLCRENVLGQVSFFRFGSELLRLPVWAASFIPTREEARCAPATQSADALSPDLTAKPNDPNHDCQDKHMLLLGPSSPS